MAKELLINVSEGEECRIALVNDGYLEELYMERQSSTSHVNNIYKGRVMNVEPSIQAAFVDFGLGRNGFLHISDLLPTYFGRKGEDVQEAVGRKMSRRDRPPIQRCLRRGDDIVVQVIKEGIGTKGPTLSTYLSIPGKILVMMPGMVSKGVSRKIEDEDERRRLRQILDQLDPPEDCGFIIRTAGVGKSKVEIERDLKYLARLWEIIKKKRDTIPGPLELYAEGDLVTRTVRDLFSSDVDQLVIDNREVADRVKDVIKLANPRAKNRVELYEEPIPLFHKYGIEREIEQMYSRHVPLRSGGSLVIDSTEAIVAIDVNSGKNRENSDAEMTAFNTDMEAADEICRQLKLRDLGGVIIVDFIDLRYERHRRELEERLEENLKHDRAKTKVLRMSQFGIIEMTRQRMRPSLKRSVYFDCPHCKGAGLVKTPESMSLDVMRRLAIASNDAKVVRVELSVNPDVAFSLLNKKRQALAQLEHDTGKQLLIKSDSSLGLDEMRLELFDSRDGIVVINELASLTQVPHKTQLNTRPAHPLPARGAKAPLARAEDRHPGRRPPQLPQKGRPRDEEQEVEEYDIEVDALEDRSEDLDRDEQDSPAPRRPADREARRPGRDGGADATDVGERADQRGGQNTTVGRTADTNGTPRGEADPTDEEQQEGEGGQRRRRRRRRRGRGRGAQQGNRDAQPLSDRAGDKDRRPLDEGEESHAEHGETVAETERDSQNDRNERVASDHREHRDDVIDRDERNIFDSREDRDDREPAPDDSRESTDFDRFEGREEPDARHEGSDESDNRDSLETDRERFSRFPAQKEVDAQEEVTETEEAIARIEASGIDTDEARELEPSVESENGVTDPVLKPRTAKRPRAQASRGKKKAKTPVPKKTTPGADSAKASAEDSEDMEVAKPKRRRGQRGGKGRKKKNAIGTTVGIEEPLLESTVPAPTGRNSSTLRETPEQEPAPESILTRTGSTDRHLADDEPVLHEPVRRPRSARDLDHIPEDYD